MPLCHQCPGADVPPLSPARYARLLASIRAHGLRRPIVVWRGKVIDGLHRLKACLEAGVEPRYEFLDDEDPFKYLADENIALRDMTQNEKALTAYLMSQYSTPGRPRTAAANSAEMRNITQGEAAELVGVSTRLVSDASRVLSEDSPAVPALREAVREWRIRCNDAAKVVARPPEMQNRAVDLVVRGEAKTIQGAVQRVEQETARAEEEAALADILARPPDETTAALDAATVAGLHGLVTARSVDAVITQPPHTEEALPLLSDLADFAAHALRGAGVMVVAGNGVILPRMLERLAHPDLRWLAEFDLVFHGKPARSGQPHFMHLHRRPVLVYGKGEFRPDGMHDLLEVPPREELPGGMTEHEAAMTMVLERFCRPGQTVCDLVMLDRAGTALAARRLGCTFLGASEMQSSIDRIRVRMARAENELGDPLYGGPGAERSPAA